MLFDPRCRWSNITWLIVYCTGVFEEKLKEMGKTSKFFSKTSSHQSEGFKRTVVGNTYNWSSGYQLHKSVFKSIFKNPTAICARASLTMILLKIYQSSNICALLMHHPLYNLTKETRYQTLLLPVCSCHQNHLGHLSCCKQSTCRSHETSLKATHFQVS